MIGVAAKVIGSQSIAMKAKVPNPLDILAVSADSLIAAEVEESGVIEVPVGK